MIEGIFGRNFMVIERALDIRMARQQLLASDIANVETPGFRALDLDFRESLRRVLRAEDTRAAERSALNGLDETLLAEGFGGPELKVVGVDGLLIGRDSNSANLELLMGKLQENSLLYNVAASLMTAKFRHLGSAIESMSK